MPHYITKDDIERTKALAHIIVSKWNPGLVCYDDVLGDGLEGLTRASQLYDENRGPAFWAYATPSVRGYMLNGFRRRFGEKKQKLVLARAESLPDFWEQPVEDNTQTSGVGLVDKIEGMNLGPIQKRIMRMMAAGYTQADISRLIGKSDANISHSVQRIRKRFSRRELTDIII